MPDDAWVDPWQGASDHLEAARRALPDPDETKLGLYREFIDHREEGLAFDILAHAADSQNAPRSVWENLRLAADVMELSEDAFPHAEAMQLVIRHL